MKLAGLLIEDPCTHDITRQEVGRKLYALEIPRKRGSQGTTCERLRETRWAFEEHMTVCHQAQNQRLDSALLSHDGAMKRRLQCLQSKCHYVMRSNWAIVASI